MERIRDRDAALDVHRDSVMAVSWVFDRATGEVVRNQERFSTMSSGVGQLGRWLLDRR